MNFGVTLIAHVYLIPATRQPQFAALHSAVRAGVPVAGSIFIARGAGRGVPTDLFAG